MYLKELVLKNFRSYVQEKVSFSCTVNAILGENGAGKTNLMEAISVLSTGKSFRSSSLVPLIHSNASSFYLEATFEKQGVEQSLSYYFDPNKKLITYNQTKHPYFHPVFGVMPTVIFSPQDICLITGSPQDRRRFINLHIAQYDPLYVYHLGRLNKVLKHRNALLKRKKVAGLELFEVEFAKSAHYLQLAREKALVALSQSLQAFFLQIATLKEQVALHYLPSIKETDPALILQKLQTTRPKELLLGTTLIGPHRDDFTFVMQKKEVKTFASEGQKRSLLAALKLAQMHLYRELLKTTPLFCIDDFAVHLDERNSTMFNHFLKEFSQTILTTPSPSVKYDHLLHIKNGSIQEESLDTPVLKETLLEESVAFDSFSQINR